MKHSTMYSRNELKDPLGPKIAMIGLILLIIYLIIAQ